MTFGQKLRQCAVADCALRLAAGVLYALVVVGAVATLANLKAFRDATLSEAHSQVAGLASTLAQHLPQPFDAEAERARLAPLVAGLGEGAVVVVMHRDGHVLLSMPEHHDAAPALPDMTTRQGTFEAPLGGDGIDRVWGYATVEGRPLLAAVGQSRAQITAGVTQLAWHMAALMLALSASAVILAYLLRHLQARRRMEQALRETHRAAVVASQAKSAFLANMSHELRTPMTGVLGMADILCRTRLDAEQTEILNTMRSSAHTLLTILNDVLDFSTIDSGGMRLHPTDFELARVVGDTVRLLTPGAVEKGLRLDAVVTPDCLRWVYGDPARLQQVLFNLISNAVKFTDHGGVIVRVQPQGGAVTFAVEDTGIGIAPDDLAPLFQPFTQADASTTRRHGGIGLGLAIAKRLIGLMGGELAATSTPGQGSVFHFTIAFPPGSPPASQEPEAPPAHQPRLRLLLAEDNPVNQTLLIRLLESAGHTVTLAQHGAQALELASQRQFDAVLMDMQMPVMDGETATKLIRMLPGEQARLPIVALTADAVEEHRQRYQAAGLDALLTKPVAPEVLFRTLDEVTARCDNASSPPASSLPPSTAPVLDDAYLEDMRQWVGDATLLSLLATAPTSFFDELQAIRAAWEAGDITGVRENAHRLKGAAGSVGCRRLAEVAQGLQKLPDADLGATGHLDQLAEAVEAALAATTTWRPSGT
ncbi:MAG TPA: ATP-binding protein [Magnetospirillum sp.]|nr:ATP-binding protein [Magnetospirillum sp.]